MKVLDLWVPGRPTTKGSVEHVGHGRVRQSVKGSTEWAGVIRRAVVAAGHLGRAGFAQRSDPVIVDMSFWLAGGDPVAERSGDVDKLARNVLDALTADPARGYRGVYADDVQVVGLTAQRFATGPNGPFGMHVVVQALDPVWLDGLTTRATRARWYAWREATDPGFEHRAGAAFGHDCFELDCGGG